jgi:anti-sigma factor RsiW
MNQKDIELLSAYLDGQLTPSDSTRLESRLRSDRELVSTLDDLRAARTLLRKLPKRRAPRNFTLTRKMVGMNPPLPRAYPAFRFATAAATLLFIFTFGVNALAPLTFGFGAPAATEAPELFSAQAPMLEAAPAATEPPAATEGLVTSTADLVPQPTMTPLPEDAARVLETPVAKVGEANQPQVEKEAPSVLSLWQTAFAVIAVLGALFMALMRRSAINRWK